MVTWLNRLHRKYHKKILKRSFTALIENGDSTFIAKPGSIFLVNDNTASKRSHLLDSGFTHLEPITDNNIINIPDAVKKLYREYFYLVKKNEIAQIDDFDFVPSILGISVPLGSQGYYTHLQ